MAWDEIREAVPVWTRSLDSVQLPDGGYWAAAGISALSEVGEHLVAVDAINNELLVLRKDDGSVERILGGFGQGPQDLSQPADAAVLGDVLVVADGGNHRLRLFNKSLESTGNVPFNENAYLVAGNSSALLGLYWNGSQTVARRFRCCPLEFLDTRELGQALAIFPHDLALTESGNQVVASPSGVIVFDPSWRPRRVFRFQGYAKHDAAGDSLGTNPNEFPDLQVHALAGGGQGEAVVISFGAYAACLNAVTGTLTAAWRPVSHVGEAVSAMSLVSSDGKEVYTFQPAGQRVSRFAQSCGGQQWGE